MVWLILTAILLALLSIILLTRLRIVIDSYGLIARISWGRVVHIFLTEQKGIPTLRLWAFGLKRDWVLFDLIHNVGTPKTKLGSHKKATDKKKVGRSRLSFRRVLRFMRSFRIHAFKLDIDTDDYVLNAYLYPLAEMLRYRGADVSVNFNGINGFKLDASNRPGRMLVAWFK